MTGAADVGDNGDELGVWVGREPKGRIFRKDRNFGIPEREEEFADDGVGVVITCEVSDDIDIEAVVVSGVETLRKFS